MGWVSIAASGTRIQKAARPPEPSCPKIRNGATPAAGLPVQERHHSSISSDHMNSSYGWKSWPVWSVKKPSLWIPFSAAGSVRSSFVIAEV